MENLERIRLEPFVTNDFGDRFLESVNQSAFRLVGYDEHLREQFGSPPFQEGKLYIIIGTDSGLLIKYLLEHGLPARTGFLLIELPEILERLSKELALNNLGKRLKVTTVGGVEEALEPLRFDSYSQLNQVVLIKSFGAIDGHLHSYTALYAAVREKINPLLWLAKAQMSKPFFLARRLGNVGENRVPATVLRGRFRGKTAIVLGGGPSLDAVLPWLEENRRHLVVLAVARISGRLRSIGLTPDFILTVDPYQVSFDNSREALSFWREANLIHSEFATPQLVGQWRGRSFYWGQRFDWDTPLVDKSMTAYGPTVTNFAVGVGIAMGFSRILLAGVDFCYSQSGITHAQGSREHSQGGVIGKNLTVETNAGTFAESGEDFIVARDNMGELAKMAQGVGCEVINLSLGAARIAWVSYQPPERIFLGADELNCMNEIMSAVPVEESGDRIAYYQSVLSELARARENLLKIGRLFKAAEVWKAKDRLAAVETALSPEQRIFYHTVKAFGFRNFTLAFAGADLENMKEDEQRRVMKLFFSAFADSSRELLVQIETVEQRLRMRLQEEEPVPDFEALAAQWRADDQPGRVLLWKDRFPDQATRLAEGDSELVQALEEEFAGMLDKSSTRMKEKKKIFNPSETRTIILDLFKKKDRAGLERIGQTSLAYHNEDGEIFASLALAYAAELAGDDALALGEYEKVVAAGAGPIVEDSLTRIVALAVKFSDLPTVLSTLEHLCRLSPAYEPRYAEALAAVGEHDRALEVYADYLDKNPTDIATMLRLGVYYQQLNFPDGAKFILGQVLALEPGNRTAGTLLSQLS